MKRASPTQSEVRIIRAEAECRWEDITTVMPVAVKDRTEVAWDLECQMAPEMVRFQPVLSVVSCCSAGG
jgi:hypothetical protein